MISSKDVEGLMAEIEQQLSVKKKKSSKRKRQLSKTEPGDELALEKPKTKKNIILNEPLSPSPIEDKVKQKGKQSLDGVEGIVAVGKKSKHKKKHSACKAKMENIDPSLYGACALGSAKEKPKHNKEGQSLDNGDSISVKPKQKAQTFSEINSDISENERFVNGKCQSSEKFATPCALKKKNKSKKHQTQSSEEANMNAEPKTASRATFLAKKKRPMGLKQSKMLKKGKNVGTKVKNKEQVLNVIDMGELEKDLDDCILHNGETEGATALPENESQTESRKEDVAGKKLSKKMKSLKLGISVDKQSEKCSKKSPKMKRDRGLSKKKKQAIEEAIDKEIPKEIDSNLNLVSDPKEIFTVGKDAYIVVMSPGQSLYVHGLVSVQILVGKAMVLGYEMKEFDKQNIFSFNSHALLSINTVEGHKLNSFKYSYLLDYGLSKHQLEETAARETEPVVVFELRKAELHIAKQLTFIKHEHLMAPRVKEGPNTLGGLIVTTENCHKYQLVKEPLEWKEMIDNICLYYECSNAPRVVLCGGKGVGKSTLFKYVVNRLLSKRGAVIQCLDTDPGQSELSVPSCVSLTQVSEPLLGPAYSHHADPASANVKHIMVGGVSPQFGLQRFIKAVRDLFELSKKHPDRPVVVNTMGWTIGTGLHIMLDIIRIVEPSHVIQIQGENRKSNFEQLLSDFVVRKYMGGVCTSPYKSELHYNLTVIQSVSRNKSQISFTPKLLRELAVLLQLSDIVIDLVENPSGLEDGSHTLILPWSEVVLHVCGSKIPKERILQVFNGNLVALCQVDSRNIEFVAPDLPKQLANDLDFGQCWGWGIVRGIDPVTKNLHILTSTLPEIIRKNVNAVVKPELYVPDMFYSFFTQGEGPYFQKMYRSGAGKLKVSRQIKPNMAKLGRKEKD